MSMILMDGFQYDESITEGIKTSKIFWYDNVQSKLKIGDKVLNYYIDGADGATQSKILTTLTQEEAPGLNISPVEFSVSTPVQ